MYRQVAQPFGNFIRPGPPKLRILTFNIHEGYNYELAKTGHRFDLILPSRGLWSPEWDTRSRPLPDNVRVMGRLADINLANLTDYDLIVAQTLEQFELVEFHPTPKLLLLHTSVSVEGTRWPSLEAMYQINNANLRERLKGVPIVYVSDYARLGWGLPGRVIDIGFDQHDYSAYRWTGDVKVVLTVSHFFKERPRDTGFELHRSIVRDDISFKIIGNNPQLASSGPASSWAELRRAYQHHAVYLDSSGGSLAGIEAMAVGMPVVKFRRSTGRYFTTDGYDAYLSADPERLRADVLRLLHDRDLARTMGERARRTVERVFDIRRFVAMWQDALADATKSRSVPPPRVAAPTDRDYFRSDISVQDMPVDLPVGQLAWTKVRVRNTGSGVWYCYTRDRFAEIRLAYHWLTPAGAVVEWDGLRTPLLVDLGPGEETQLDAVLCAPDAPGAYVLAWDLVCEHAAWFSTHGNPTINFPIVVVDPGRSLQ